MRDSAAGQELQARRPDSRFGIPGVRPHYLPALLLVLVAVVQIALVRAIDLTPWKGGGFGMFSTLDHGAFRGVRIVIDGPGRSEALEIPASLEAIAARAIACPSTWLLREFAEGIVARERRYERPVSQV